MNNLYGNQFIEKQRSSGYKSTIYAMAEIVDNSVDAQANEIDIILVEEEQHRGKRRTIALSEIIFLDNGAGMNETMLNGCLTFSEGEGSSDKRIGAFGVGLPNSSISVGRRVDVYSKKKDKKWKHVFLDLDDQMNRPEPGYDKAVQKEPDFGYKLNIPKGTNTIVRWSKLDKIDAAKADTIIDRGSKLMGRIYRYSIQNGLKIRMASIIKGNTSYTKRPQEIIPYDPLFLMEEKNYITDLIWASATKNEYTDSEITDKEFTSIHHYKKFIKDCKKNKTNKAIFQKHDEYHDITYNTTLEGKKYKWTIKASYAYKSISNPGMRSGGSTELGKMLGQKMSGHMHFKSGNIFFMRANREIDFGNFGLYTVTDEKNRFWTIEIHFDSELDNLMGISNTKQSVDFWAVTNSDSSYINKDEKIPEGQKREILYAHITETIQRCIKEMRSYLSVYAREFKDLRDLKINQTNPGIPNGNVPKAEPAVIQVLPSGLPWTKKEKDSIIEFLKEQYMHLSLDEIKVQVDIFAKGLTKTLVLYAPNNTGHLYEIKERVGKLITLINTNHIYYQNVIAPLKSNQHLKVFAISIEMLISAYAYEMDKLILDDETKHKTTFKLYTEQLSSRLAMFIDDANILVNPEEWERKTFDTDDNQD